MDTEKRLDTLNTIKSWIAASEQKIDETLDILNSQIGCLDAQANAAFEVSLELNAAYDKLECAWSKVQGMKADLEIMLQRGESL